MVERRRAQRESGQVFGPGGSLGDVGPEGRANEYGVLDLVPGGRKANFPSPALHERVPNDQDRDR